jgi:hypothetical protein
MAFKHDAPKKIPAEASVPVGQLSIRYRAIDSLRPYAHNSRTHSAKQIGKLELSLAKFGWTNPLLLAGDDVLAGHARLQAATNIRDKAGLIARHADLRIVPTIDLSHLSPAERRAYIIADNRLALDAGWDNELLRIELGDLQTEGFDLSLTGFSAVELGTYFGKADDPEGPRLADRLQYQVVIECTDEADQAAILEELQGRSIKCRPLIL